MQNLQHELIELLKDQENLVIDGKLNKNKIIEVGLKLEPKLLHLLLQNKSFKEHFFTEVENVIVFDKIKFQRFVNNKSFLPDSYTSFKNKIGLVLNDDFQHHYINTKNDVVLAFPHKDCVLEGGQTKDDQKRKEIFWNETLAPNSIDRLLSPKTLTNFKKYDKNGTHKITELNGNENLIIKGNNLLAISSLRQTHRGKIKLIYIDPPYNTGNDSFNYNDNFNHSTWLTFMKNRLKIARELLSDDGVIFVQCDDNEQAYLKVLMDEIFGRENFVNCIVAEMSNLSGNKIEHAIQGRKFPKIKEYILLYSKNKNNCKLIIPKQTKTKWDNEYNIILPNLKREDYDLIKQMILNDKEFELNEILKNQKITSLKEYLKERKIDDVNRWKTENSYRIFASKPNKSLKKKALELDFDSQIKSLKNQRGDLKIIRTDFNRETETARIELVFAKDNLEVFYGDIWKNITTTGGVAREGEVSLTNGKKPEELLKLIIETSTKENDLVLDFHLGSGTTCAVAHKMNRKYIGIEQMDYIEDIAVERLKKVIEGEQGGISKLVNWQGGGEFVYCELMPYNQIFISQLQQAKTKEEVLAIWYEMNERATFNYQFDKEIFNKRLEAFKTASLEEMKRYLFEVLDKNQLYVNYSEIDDNLFTVSEEDKKLNKQFYKKRR